MKKPNGKVTQSNKYKRRFRTSFFINIICRMLTLFLTNRRDRNGNTTFKNSYKSTIIDIGNGMYY